MLCCYTHTFSCTCVKVVALVRFLDFSFGQFLPLDFVLALLFFAAANCRNVFFLSFGAVVVQFNACQQVKYVNLCKLDKEEEEEKESQQAGKGTEMK